MIIKNKKIPVMPINKTQKRLYAGSSDPTFEHDTLNSMQEYLNNPTAYVGQLLYCKDNDKHYRIAKGDNNQKTLKEIVGEMTSENITYSNEEMPDVSNVKSALDTIKSQVADGGLLKIVNNLEEANNIPNLKDGMICYVNDEKAFFSREDEEWVTFKGDTGGVTASTLKSSYDGQELSVSVGESITVDLFFATPNLGKGTLYVKANNKEIVKQEIKPGDSTVTFTLEKGKQTVLIYVKDRTGAFTNNVQFTVQCGGLEIKTTFNWDETYKVGIPIKIQYEIDTISTEDVIVNFKIGTRTIQQTTKNKHNVFTLPTDFGAGAYKVEIWAKSGTFESNHIVAELVILNSESLFVSTMFDKTEAEEGDQLIINYRVSMEGVKEFDVVYIVNGEQHSTAKAINGGNMFAISTLPIKEDNKIEIKVTAPNGQTFTLPIHIKIVASTYKVQTPVSDDTLLLYVDAYERSNQLQDKGVWKDKRTDKVIGELYNFNYGTNGWMDNGLKMNGNAYVKLNLQPFKDNAPDGLTIDIEFKTEDIGNEDARVLDCTTTLGTGLGCFIDTGKANIKSQKGETSSPFAQNEKTRVTYVIDRANKITKLYINAVMSAVWKLTDMGEGVHKQLESFQHDDYIYLNSTRGTSNFGDCTVYSVRVYNRALESEEVLQNFIADIRDKDKQKAKYDFNHKDTIPTMTFVCDPVKFKEMSKKDPVTMQIQYVSTNPTLYGQSFDLSNCEVKWQGTSSIVYDVKNYKIKLYEDPDGTEEPGSKPKKYKHALREDMIKESTFVLKADYMESSHANNTGLAKIVNKYLYDDDKKLPPQEKDPRVVSAIDGFPIKLYLNEELMGIFNFNLDKGNEKSFGFDKKNENCISYEISANTDTTAGAFFKYDDYKKKYSDWETKFPTELDYLKSSFEQRFPDEDDEDKANYGYIDKLKPLIDWVSDASDDEFRENFDKHFDREYTFKYYLFVLIMGMVDNLGKNMMLCTWDGEKWFPCFYDLDTCLSLNNTGFIKFDVDIEIEPEIYNTSGSRLWTKVGRVFEKELKDMYVKMRSNKFKEKEIFDVLIGEQVDQIPELLYNEDSQKKYIDHPEYLSMLHGSRREHMKKWITERLLYLDSKFGYEPTTGDAIIIRANKQGNVSFNIKTYSPMYIKIKWSNESGGVKLQKVGRNKTVTFSYNIATNTDQEINIYSAQHLKEIGDISAMNPSSLILGNATKLTKLICKNSSSLSSIGLGGKTNGVDKRMKNLQEVDLTDCSKLGTTDTSRSLDVSYCDNLKTLKAQGTNLQNIQFNPAGGNLEELYLPNSMTSLYLANQYNLNKVIFSTYSHVDRLEHWFVYDRCSKISNITINNCPQLTLLGVDRNVNRIDYDNVCNYLGQKLNGQPSDFSISKEEYTQAFSLSIFGRLETVEISNSLLNYKYYNINISPNLARVSFNNMPNLKGLILTGNRTYGGSGGNSYMNLEGVPRFENIEVDNCEEFDTLIIQKPYNGFNHAYKFKKDFTLDLSHLRLKKFICGIALQNLKKIILPETIEEFIHHSTQIQTSNWDNGHSSSIYTKTDSPLETIVITGQHIDDDFRGIDLADKQLKNVNLNGLTQNVDMIKNVNCEAVDICPRIISEHVDNQVMENIKINLDNFKGKSLAGMLAKADLDIVKVTLNNTLSAPDIDYSHMFNKAKNVRWDNIKDFIGKLPRGKFYRTFEKCDVDRLEVGQMIGETTVDMTSCFENMPNVTSIDLTNADFSQVSSFRLTLANCPLLASDIILDYTGSNTSPDLQQMFHSTPNLGKVTFINLERCSNWKAIFTNVKNVKATGMPKVKTTNNDNTLWNCWSKRGTVDIRYNTNITIDKPNESLSPHTSGGGNNAGRTYTVETLENLIAHLRDYRDTTGQTISIGATNIENLSPEQLKIAKDKNWTIIA